jgi:hypothetical protein
LKFVSGALICSRFFGKLVLNWETTGAEPFVQFGTPSTA